MLTLTITNQYTHVILILCTYVATMHGYFYVYTDSFDNAVILQ